MRFLFQFLCILSIFLLVACSGDNQVPEIKIGHAPHDHHSALYIAALRPDFFRENAGVYLRELEFRKRYELYEGSRLLATLSFTSSTGGGQLIRRLRERQLDLVMGSVPAMLREIDAGGSLRIIAPVMTEGAAFVLRKDLEIGDWESFVRYVSQAETPLRIGYKTGLSVQNLIFESALAHEGIPFSTNLSSQEAKLILVNMHGAKNLIPGMRNGVIDGFVVMQPFVALAEKELGARVVCPLGEMPPKGYWQGYPCCALAAESSAFVQENEPAVVALLRLIRAAHGYIASYPDDAAKAVAFWLELPEEVEQVALPSSTFLQDFSSEWDMGVQRWRDFLAASGKLQGVVAKAEAPGDLEKQLYEKEPFFRANEGRP